VENTDEVTAADRRRPSGTSCVEILSARNKAQSVVSGRPDQPAIDHNLLHAAAKPGDEAFVFVGMAGNSRRLKIPSTLAELEGFFETQRI
jgi:hypothetical protein